MSNVPEQIRGLMRVEDSTNRMTKQYNDKWFREMVKALLDGIKETSIQRKYHDKVTDAEMMGLLVSRYFKWGGTPIAQTASHAFEDANYHKFNEDFMEMWKRENGIPLFEENVTEETV